MKKLFSSKYSDNSITFSLLMLRLSMGGLMTRLATIPLIIAMSVALFYSHNGEMFGEGEKAALFLAGYIALLFAGPGKLSADKLIGK